MLLRCVDSRHFALGDEAPLSAADLVSRLGARVGTEAMHAVQLLLPATRCLVVELPVAKHEARLLAKTLPWTLEDRLLEPAEQLHFAHGPVAAGHAPVAAVNAAWLQEVLDTLRNAGLQAQSASSELFMLPWQPGHWTVFMPAAATAPVLVRHGAHAGFACARANLHTALQLLLNEHNEPPRQVAVIAEPPAQVDNALLFPPLLQAKLMLQRQSAGQLAQSAVLPPCNLLQGRFAPALPWAQWWRQWRVAAVLLAGLFVTDLALSAYASMRARNAAEQIEADIVALYRSVQPEGAIVDARVQLEQALAAAGTNGQPGFLALLGRIAPALQAAPGTTVQNLEYDSATGDLHMQILTSDFTRADNLRLHLQQLGLQAESLGSSSDSAGWRARLRVGS